MSRLEWILGLVLLGLLIVVVGLAASLWLNPSRPTTMSSAPSEMALLAASAGQVEPMRATAVQTAKSDYLLAYQTAQSWQGDAALINATATWPQGATAANLTPGEEMWGFIFYSPAARTTAVVSVANGAATLSARNTQRDVRPLDVTGWRLDSNQATELFLSNGGQAFLEREGVTIYSMALSLNNPNEDGRIEWLMSLLAPGNGRSYTMRLDATSGEILEIIDASGN